MEGALQNRPPAKQLVVGFDFGTTFSGVSWQEYYAHGKALSEADIPTVRSWPSSHGPDQDESKVPSRLVYDDEGEITAWGFENPGADGVNMEWFKLAIVPDQDLPAYLQDSAKLAETRRQLRDLKTSATRVIQQYIEKVWTHSKREIRNGVGDRDFDSMPIHVVITIPAIWGNQAIDMMKDAASSSILQSGLAGLTTYEFISEPEAAVQAYAQKLQLKLAENDIVMVVDLGGGTADIISYQKIGKGEKSYLELREAAPGDGDLCGAIFVDEAFEALLLSRLPAKHKNLKTKDPGAWRRILSEQWQHHIKRSFKWEGTGKMWRVILSNVNHNVDAVRLHEDEIRAVFEGSVMPKIINLIKRQIEKIKKAHGGKTPSIILPVGGFGRCPYILQRLREEFESSSSSASAKKNSKKKQKLDSGGIEIHSATGEVPWTAVCRGACQFGMRAQLNNRLVRSRSSRISVGFIINEPGSAEEGGIWMPEFDDYMIPNFMRWVVKKACLSVPSPLFWHPVHFVGDSIDTDQNSTMAMYLGFDLPARGFHSERSTFYANNSDSPPKLFEDMAAFQEYGVMTITTSKRVERLPIEDSDSGGRRVFDYRLEVEIVGGSVQITATSTDPDDDGKEVGKLVLPTLDAV